MNDYFDADGLAIVNFSDDVHFYDPHNYEYLATHDHFINVGTGLPAFSTLVEPPKRKQGCARVFDESIQNWKFIDDHRRKIVYDINTNKSLEVLYLGSLKSIHTETPPPSDLHSWDGAEWILTDDAIKQIEAEEKQQQIITLENQLNAVRYELDIYRDIDNRSEEDEAKFQALKAQSTELYKQIQALKS